MPSDMLVYTDGEDQYHLRRGTEGAELVLDAWEMADVIRKAINYTAHAPDKAVWVAETVDELVALFEPY